MDNIIFTDMNSAMNEKNHETWKESKKRLFIYIFLISYFDLLKQHACLRTTKTVLILVVYTPAVFSKPTANWVNLSKTYFYITLLDDCFPIFFQWTKLKKDLCEFYKFLKDTFGRLLLNFLLRGTTFFLLRLLNVMNILNLIILTISWRRPLSYRNQSIGLLCKSIEKPVRWFALQINGLVSIW